jgi:hypothetical protein
LVGLGPSRGGVDFGVSLAQPANTYATRSINGQGRFINYQLSELPVGARSEAPNVQGHVYGCGILIDPDNKLTAFSTLNGILLGEFYLEVSVKYISEKQPKISRIFIINLCIFLLTT